ncbi:MAG: type V CRISPR-associated protein Cas4 [Lentisphaeria bacterium]|nr:type V CRISPR-associated protein Cas4 [Lentisphaeria bacterium]
MEPYLCITQLNDFVFCPRSIYFHNIYQQNYGTETYHKTWQKRGQAAHRAVDEGAYSSRKDILQGLPVYSTRYNLGGKIDTLDLRTGELVERKYSVTKIYDGFRYQVYAQYFALTEMGYDVCSAKIYSKKSNKSYPIPLPGHEEKQEFEELLERIKGFTLDAPFFQNPRKCMHCIYNMMCDIYTGEE